ncbi:hypothetical protein CDAR_219221 [Caerostris darwini]|uniref:Uncharacterized protein n=1 Tax=Caerostris darwini TaxID=1538125 RepID=A0AAV4R7A2_9ARAC|nr:hypothetical protein CDAR_219221 [Caerostris darwini]
MHSHSNHHQVITFEASSNGIPSHSKNHQMICHHFRSTIQSHSKHHQMVCHHIRNTSNGIHNIITCETPSNGMPSYSKSHEITFETSSNAMPFYSKASIYILSYITP